jgi:hypothetical protein
MNSSKKWKIWRSSNQPPACDTTIESRTGDWQKDVDDGWRTVHEMFIELTLDKVSWII